MKKSWVELRRLKEIQCRKRGCKTMHDIFCCDCDLAKEYVKRWREVKIKGKVKTYTFLLNKERGG